MNDEAAEMLEKIHYAHVVPAAVQLVGCWREDGGLFGDKGQCAAVCVFTIPPTRWSATVWELARLVRRDDAKVSLSGLISECVAHIRKHRLADLLVSFADPTHGHHGGIYQAASWKFHGKRDASCDGLFIDGKYIPGRSLNNAYGTRSAAKLSCQIEAEIIEHWDEGKYLYWKPIGSKGNRKARTLNLKNNPYPKPDLELRVSA